jgi:phenylalanyl-tRNA synthetase beta chain
MKVPISWLREYIDIDDLSIQDLADRMTFAGIEIEGVETIGGVPAGLVVGEVRVCEPVPESDHLHKCRVFDGQQELDVLCGAPNCRAGLKSCFAPVGTVLPGGFTISKRKLLKKYESFGMLCSAAEIGVSDDHSGIIEVDPSVPAGTPYSELAGKPETVFDVEITWNRPDVLSILGVAREFGAILRRPVKLPSVDFTESDVPVETCAAVEVRDPVGCPRYTARVIEGVTRRPSPEWMRKRLELCGQRSIDIVVDVSNYVMLECGQPLHTFDYDEIHGHKIVVRRADPGETMRTLDGTDHALDPAKHLVIADADRAVALAGVMGGEDSEIKEGTNCVLLESATFAAPTIKISGTSAGIHTESSHRYERGVDPGLADWASRRAAHLLATYAEGRVCRGVVDCDHRDTEPVRVSLRYQRVRDVVGVPLTDDEIDAFLESLSIHKVDGCALGMCPMPGTALFEAPSYRVDIVDEADLVEEVARLNGLDKLPDLPPDTSVVPGVDDADFRALVKIRHTLVDLGLHEAMHYSFLAAGELDAFDKGDEAKRLVLPNPVSADFGVMRDSLLPQLAASLGRNAARQESVVALFELGRVFSRGDDGAPREENHLAIGITGPFGRAETDRVRPVTNEEALLVLKGVLETLGAAMHAPAVRLERADYPGFEPGWGATVFVAGKPVGRIGLVAAAIRHNWRVNQPMAVVETTREAWTGNATKVPSCKPVPPFPSTYRDIAFLADASVTHENILKVIRKAAPAELASVRLFAIYEGKNIGAGRRSLAYTLEYRSAERTLRDDEVNKMNEKVREALKTKLGVELREA